MTSPTGVPFWDCEAQAEIPEVDRSFPRRVAFLAALSVATLCIATPSLAEKYPYLHGNDLKNNSCNAAFNSYLSCFEGTNMKKCEAKFGKRDCRAEQSAAQGDLGVAHARESWGASCKDMIGMLKENIRRYQKGWGCQPAP